MSASFDNALHMHDLDHTRLIILRNVIRDTDADPSGVSVRTLSERLFFSRELLEDRCKALEHAGLIEISSAADDWVLRPTAKGRKLLPVLIDAARWTHEQALNGFSNEEVRELSDALRRVMANLGVQPPDAD
jgi:DNA-binding MarR family transcriptional regulator